MLTVLLDLVFLYYQIIETGVLKLSIMTDLSGSPFGSAHFCFMHIEAMSPEL